MIRYFFRLLKGYVRIQIKSISPEYFLERCRINGIFFWELVCLKKGEYQCSLFLKDFYRLRGCARGKGVRLRICERRGLPFFLRRNQKRWYAAAGFFSFFLLLYIMSLFLWDIHFQGNHHYTADTLVRYLDTQDVRYGMKKKKINCEELEAGMREAFPQITWVSARVSGTRLVIQIKENKIIQDKTAVEEEACDLVSNVSGTITYIMVRQGVPKVKKGEKIEKACLLSFVLLFSTLSQSIVATTVYAGNILMMEQDSELPVKEDQADITDQDHQEKNTDTENTNSDKEQGTEESTDSDKIVTAYV